MLSGFSSPVSQRRQADTEQGDRRGFGNGEVTDSGDTGTESRIGRIDPPPENVSLCYGNPLRPGNVRAGNWIELEEGAVKQISEIFECFGIILRKTPVKVDHLC